MIQPNEVVMLIIGLGVLIFILGNRSQLERIPFSRVLLLGFYSLLAGWALTVLESFFWNEFFNYLEHTCYATASLFLAAWCWKVLGKTRESG
jgi:hypothetical protein